MRALSCYPVNLEFVSYVCQAQQFDWAVYFFLKNGHFSFKIQSHNLSNIFLACNSYELGRALLQEFATTATVFNPGNDLLNHIRTSSDNTLVIHGYLVKSYDFQTS